MAAGEPAGISAALMWADIGGEGSVVGLLELDCGAVPRLL
jgi:hypothetical protein